jgi:hypothetical protein
LGGFTVQIDRAVLGIGPTGAVSLAGAARDGDMRSVALDEAHERAMVWTGNQHGLMMHDAPVHHVAGLEFHANQAGGFVPQDFGSISSHPLIQIALDRPREPIILCIVK